MICPYYPEKVHSHSDRICPYRSLCSTKEASYHLYEDMWDMPRCRRIDASIKKIKKESSLS